MDTSDPTFQPFDPLFQVAPRVARAGPAEDLAESLVCIPCRLGDVTLTEARMMARLYWNSAVPSWIDCFDRFSAAWLMAIVFVLCGCQFYPPPAPHVRVDVSQRAPRMEPSRPVEPLRAPEPRPIAPDPRDPFESNKIEPEAPARDDATDRLAAEPEPIAFAQQGPAAALPHVFGPFEMGAALTTNDIFSSQGR